MRRHTTSAVAAIFALSLLAACTDTAPEDTETTGSEAGETETDDEPDAGADDPAQVQLALLAPGSLQWLHAIAADQGFYAGNGVEIEEIQVQNSANLVQAVASGSADAGIALGDNVISAVDEGADVLITGALFQRPALRLFGAPGVEDITDLEGAEVTAGAVEGGTANLLFYLLEEHGVEWESTTPVAIPNSSDRIVAMQNEQVRGALLIPPFDSIAVADGATLLATYDDYYVQTPAIVNGSWAEANPEAAGGFTRALQRAADWIYDPANEDDAVRVLEEYASVDTFAAEEAYEFMVGAEIISPRLAVPAEGLTNIVEISASITGQDVSGFDPEEYIDTSYLAE